MSSNFFYFFGYINFNNSLVIPKLSFLITDLPRSTQQCQRCCNRSCKFFISHNSSAFMLKKRDIHIKPKSYELLGWLFNMVSELGLILISPYGSPDCSRPQRKAD